MVFKIEDGILWEYTSDEEVIPVPFGVTKIVYNAFRDCKMKKVIIPRSVEYLMQGAFQNCPNLKEIELPWTCEVDRFIHDEDGEVDCYVYGKPEPGQFKLIRYE